MDRDPERRDRLTDTASPPRDDGSLGEIPHLVAHLFRRSAGAMVASLTRRHGIEALTKAEDAVQEALFEALRRWPFDGVPHEPAAWLRTVAQRKLVDALRREGAQARAISRVGEAIAADDEGLEDAEHRDDLPGEDVLGDDVLGMLFACCTPTLEREVAVALTLSVVAGFTAREIGQAFLVGEGAMAQRLVRARKRLRESGERVEIPRQLQELEPRLSRVLQVVYLMFNEGYVATEGDAVMRADLCREAVRLAVLLAEHPVAGSPESNALAALLLFQLARAPSRTDAAGTPILMEQQDRSAWDPALLGAAYRHLERAGRGERLTSLHLQAEIASRHAMAAHFDQTDWSSILAAYDRLLGVEPTLVVRVNRAVAVGRVRGTAAALAALQEGGAEGEAVATGYRWYFAVRAHFRAEAGDSAGASDDLRRATTLTRSTPLVRWLEERHSALLDSSA
jgi:RNA polymerase sigma factor (sigma-70 family)